MSPSKTMAARRQMRTPGERTSGAWTGGCAIHPDGGDETDRTAGNSYTATPHNTQGATSNKQKPNELPDSEMKQTWLDAGTATLVEDEPEAPAPRAQMLTAQPGQIGISNSGNEDDLAGRIPKSIERATDPVKKPTRSRKK